MAYRGESPAKKMVRLRLWQTVASLLGGPDQFLAGKHLVLSSREAGDVRHLLALGVPASNVLAVDLDPIAVELVNSQFPEVRTLCQDVFKVDLRVRKKQRKRPSRLLASAHIDLCGGLSPSTIEGLSNFVVTNMDRRSVLAVTFLRGRERAMSAIESRRTYMAEKDSKDAAGWEADVVNMIVKFIRWHGVGGTDQGIWDRFVAIADPVFGDREKTVIHEKYRAHAARTMMLTEDLVSACVRRNVAIFPAADFAYRSSGSDSRGSSMSTFVFDVDKGFRGMSLDPFVFTATFMNRSNVIDSGYSFDSTEADIRETALDMARALDAEVVSGLLNIPRRTLSAWAAHETRGTYG